MIKEKVIQTKVLEIDLLLIIPLKIHSFISNSGLIIPQSQRTQSLFLEIKCFLKVNYQCLNYNIIDSNFLKDIFFLLLHHYYFYPL